MKPDLSREVGALRLLALDLGERRIGLAVSDATGTLALPAGHLVRTKLAEDLRRVLEAARERDVEAFVVGMPYSLDGTTGPQAKQAQGFINALRKRTTLPVHTMDERFTSVEAEALLRASGHQPSRQRATVDEAAATLILQRFLDSRRESAGS